MSDKIALLAIMKEVFLEAFNPNNTLPVVMQGGGSIMLLSGFAANGTGTLHKVDGILEGEDCNPNKIRLVHLVLFFKKSLKMHAVQSFDPGIKNTSKK